MGCIYKITNNITNKLYIGYTTQDIEKRMQQHKNNDVFLNTLLGRAIAKYGWSNFSYEIVQETNNKEVLLELEQYYIQFFHSLAPDGYNMTLGGERLYGKNNPFYLHRHSVETRKKLSKLAQARLGEANPFYGKHHSEKTREIISQKNSKPIAMLDDNKDIIQIFPSGIVAKNWLIKNHLTNNNYANSSITKAIKKNQRAYGYYWKYIEKNVETMDK